MPPSFVHHPLLSWVELFLHDHPSSQLYVVGGTVRDALLGRESSDFDLVISQVEPTQLETWLEQHGHVSYVGKRFGVWKFTPHHDPTLPAIDIALPRKERPFGHQGGYRHFVIESDPTLPIEDDLSRRDFTVNAMAYDWRTGELIDPFGGQTDLKQRLIRCVGTPWKRFEEDSSRLLRALRFACRLRAEIEDVTWKDLLTTVPRLSIEDQGRRVVARELMLEEFLKTLSANPKRCLELYERTGIWSHLFGYHPFKRSPRWFASLSTPTSTQHLLTLLLFDVFDEPGDVHDWLHTWHADMFLSTSTVLQLVRALNTSPEQISLATLERSLLPHLEELQHLLTITSHPDASRWASRLHMAFKRTHLPSLLSSQQIQTIPEGPKRGLFIDAIRSAQLEGRIQTEKEAEALLHHLLEEHGV